MNDLKDANWGQAHLGGEYHSVAIDRREGTPDGLEEIINQRLLKNTDGPEGRIYEKAIRALQYSISLTGNVKVRLEAFPAKVRTFSNDIPKPGIIIVGRDESHDDPETTGEHVIALTFGEGLSFLEAYWVSRQVRNDDFCFTFLSTGESNESPGKLAVEVA
jgi:hypothetical protein